MTSAPEHLPPEYSLNKFMPAGAQGLEKIALCTAGDIITFIACGTADLFPVPLTAMQREDYCSTHPPSLHVWGRMV